MIRHSMDLLTVNCMKLLLSQSLEQCLDCNLLCCVELLFGLTICTAGRIPILLLQLIPICPPTPVSESRTASTASCRPPNAVQTSAALSKMLLAHREACRPRCPACPDPYRYLSKSKAQAPSAPFFVPALRWSLFCEYDIILDYPRRAHQYASEGRIKN